MTPYIANPPARFSLDISVDPFAMLLTGATTKLKQTLGIFQAMRKANDNGRRF